MAFFIFWIFLSVLVGAYASSKKRSGVGWFFLSLIISPLIAFIIVLVAGSPQGTLKKCPKCAEEVKIEAQVCRFCGFEFPSAEYLKNQSLEEVLEKEGECIKKIESLKKEIEKLSGQIEAFENPVVKKHFQIKKDQVEKELNDLKNHS